MSQSKNVPSRLKANISKANICSEGGAIGVCLGSPDEPLPLGPLELIAKVSRRLIHDSSLLHSFAVEVFLLQGHKNVTLAACRPVREEGHLCMLIGLSQPPPSSLAANAQLLLRGRVWAQSTAKIKQEIRSWGKYSPDVCGRTGGLESRPKEEEEEEEEEGLSLGWRNRHKPATFDATATNRSRLSISVPARWRSGDPEGHLEAPPASRSPPIPLSTSPFHPSIFHTGDRKRPGGALLPPAGSVGNCTRSCSTETRLKRISVFLRDLAEKKVRINIEGQNQQLPG